MKIKLISYGHKFYEGAGEAPPYHDFLFSLRDITNPYWIPELKSFNGQDPEIIEFFEKDELTQDRLSKISNLVFNFIEDFVNNEYREGKDRLVFAFKCTGGKHRSVYFANAVQQNLQVKSLEPAVARLLADIEFEVEHVDLHKYLEAKI